MPNPIFIKNNHKYEIISEKVLQKLILEDISTFLKELGSSFTLQDYFVIYIYHHLLNKKNILKKQIF